MKDFFLAILDFLDFCLSKFTDTVNSRTGHIDSFCGFRFGSLPDQLKGNEKGIIDLPPADNSPSVRYCIVRYDLKEGIYGVCCLRKTNHQKILEDELQMLIDVYESEYGIKFSHSREDKYHYVAFISPSKRHARIGYYQEFIVQGFKEDGVHSIEVTLNDFGIINKLIGIK